jgi:sec-independent protein translocase protein TatB
MFDIGWSELLLIGVVALIVIGPKELPGALRMVGQWTAKLRRMASDFQGQFHEAMREAEMVDLKKQVDDLTSEAREYTSFDPIGDVRREVESTQRQIENTIEPPAPSNSPVAASSPEVGQSPSPPDAPPQPGAAAPAAVESSGAAGSAPSRDAMLGSPAPPAPSGGEPARQDAGGQPA